MERDVLVEVLEASGSRGSIAAPPSARLVSLISFSTLRPTDLDRVRHFQTAVKSRLGLTLIVVGGGYGCTKIIVKIVELESDDPQEAATVLAELLGGQIIRDEARKVPFDVLITSEPYARRNLRTGETDGATGRVTINAEVIMGDKHEEHYNVERAGIVGRDVKVENFTQIWNEWNSTPDAPDVAVLATQLSTLRQQLKAAARTVEEDAATGAVAQAELAARSGDGSKSLAALAAAGKWALGVAEKIGVAVAAGAIRKAMGLP